MERQRLRSGSSPMTRAQKAPALACVLLAAAYGLWANSPFVMRTSWWHWWQYPLDPHWSALLAGPAAGLGLCAWLFARGRRAAAIALASLCLGAATDLIMGHEYPRRLITTYVSESFQANWTDTLFHYDRIVANAIWPYWVDTKPPGRILAFLVTREASSLLASDGPLRWLVSCTMWLGIHHAAGLATIALVYRSVEELRGRSAATLAASVLAFSPAYILVDLQFATRIYPLVAVLMWRLMRDGLTPARGAAAALLWSVAFYTGFSMSSVAVMVPAFAALWLWKGDRRQTVWGAVALSAVAMAFYAFLQGALGYDHLARMMSGVLKHETEFGMDLLPFEDRAWYSLRGLIEVSMSAGGAFAALFLWAVWRGAAAGLLHGPRAAAEVLAPRYWPVLVTIFALPLPMAVITETARLWAFSIPLAALVVGEVPATRRLTVIAVACQVGLIGAYLLVQFFTYGKTA